MQTLRTLHVAGARPNFMKVAPVMAAVDSWNAGAGAAGGLRFSQMLVHTGQHYDRQMSEVFFRDLALREPDYNLEVGSASHAAQTAAVLQRLEPVLVKEQPDLVIVVGDVNSTLAAALCAAKLGIPVAHVEAGLRSYDRSMPEELNRVLTDQIADLLFTTEWNCTANLTREGIPVESVHFVGNTMIDSLDRLRPKMDVSGALLRAGVAPRGFALVTLHRPSNVDDPQQLARLVDTLAVVARRVPVVWPVHLRAAARLAGQGEEALRRAAHDGLLFREPLSYSEFLALLSQARIVLTDSGGIQEETTVLGVPCLTLRTSTERPVTLMEGTNRLVDPYDPEAIVAAVEGVLSEPLPKPKRPLRWDGRAAERIVGVIADWAANRRRDDGGV